MAEKLDIKPADGKLGILTPGMGAVSSTFMAGIMAIRKGLSLPIGSLTQMGHIRLGKRTDGRQPLVKNFVPLADLDDLAAETMRRHAVEAADLLDGLRQRNAVALREHVARLCVRFLLQRHPDTS